ncbi:MAG: hypothetical protein MJ154_00625 [Candidatus Saccharibacteria bacterium]|nr:hypothetical protein [Candidatus Saccharibacteria bacterium]
MDIYLDIYGTLIANNSPKADKEALLTFILDNFAGNIYWLTSYSEQRIPEVLAGEYEGDLLARLQNEIQYCQSGIYKSDSIDFSRPFVWLDDNQSEADYYALKTHNALDNFIHMNPSDAEMAEKALEVLKYKHGNSQ